MRLQSRDIEPAGAAITITFDGAAVAALPGETLAASLIAAGCFSQRRTQSGKARGVFCAMGVCHDCLVTVDGRPSQRACLTKVSAAMTVTSQHDGLAHPDKDGPALATAPENGLPEQHCQILVIGAGPAGLGAAIAAVEAGAEVTVVDERLDPGGQYFKPLAQSQRAARPGDEQFRQGAALLRRLRDLPITLLGEASVWGAYRDAAQALEIGILHKDRAQILKPRQLIVATGAYERALPVPGWTLPGAMTTGAAQTLARSYRVAPGQRVLIAGNGPLNLQVACELLAGGARIIAVIEAAQPPWRRALTALAAGRYAPALMIQGIAYLAKLKRHRVKVWYEHVVTRLDGSERVETATIARLDHHGRAISASSREFAVDAVCMGYGFAPANELLRLLGCEQYYSSRGGYLVTRCDDDGRTSQADVYAVGEAGAIGGAQIALQQGRLAGWRAAEAAGHRPASGGTRRRAGHKLRRHRGFQRALWSLFQTPELGLQFATADTLICRCEEVSLGRLRSLIGAGVADIGTLKRLTRAGMGRCQGRYCAALLVRLLADAARREPRPYDYFAPQTPLKPVPAIALAAEKAEWGGHERAQPAPGRAPASHSGQPLTTEVLIIGAGIVGCSSAYFLAEAGRDTLLIDRGEPNGQASGGNAGSLHVQLLSFDFGAKAEAGGDPAAATLPLQKASVELWQKLQQTLDKDFEISIGGGLMVAESERDLRFLEAKAKIERAQGIEVELVGQNDLRTLAPAVDERLLGAAYCPQEGKINPLIATDAILQSAIDHGARLRKYCEVFAIERKSGGFAVSTNRGLIRCACIVNAAGAWSATIARMVNVAIPVHGAPLQMIVSEAVTPLLEQLLAHADRHLTMKQARNGNLIIGGGWTAGLNPKTGFSQVLRESIEGNLWIAQHLLPALRQTHILRTWAAMNINIDGAPIIGEMPSVSGFYNAVTSNGYTLGPIIGQLTAQLIDRGRSDWDLTPFALERFR